MKITLRPLEESDAGGMLEWMNDPQIQKWFRFPAGHGGEAEVLAFIREAETLPVDGKSIHYAVADERDEYLGTASLKNVNLPDRNAEYAISLRKRAQGQGIGAQATKLLLQKAFEDFQLERVYLNVLADNRKAIQLYEKAGFVYEGEFRNCIFLRGGYRTLRWYSMLRMEYFHLFSGGGKREHRKEINWKSTASHYLFAVQRKETVSGEAA